MYACTHMHVCTYVHTHMYVRTYVCICMYTYICVYVPYNGYSSSGEKCYHFKNKITKFYFIKHIISVYYECHTLPIHHWLLVTKKAKFCRQKYIPTTQLHSMHTQYILWSDGVSGRVLQQVVHIVVVYLHKGHEHCVATVLVHHLVYPLGLRDTQQVTVVRLLSPALYIHIHNTVSGKGFCMNIGQPLNKEHISRSKINAHCLYLTIRPALKVSFIRLVYIW